MVSAFVVVALMSLQPSATWFGPATASFNLMFAGNPYDPAENDVHVKFVGPKGEPIDRIAYFDGHSAWKAVLVTPVAGHYVATLYRNGVKAQLPAEEGILDVEAPIAVGYIHPDAVYMNRFRRDTGQPYYPVGFDLGWQNANSLPMKDEIAKMGAAGVSWTRIWATSWDGRNPWYPTGDPKPVPGQLWTPALDKWQELVDACDAHGVGFQMTLFYHGAFSSRVNANWPDHPWNVKNGGFLKDAGDFFTDPEAKRRTRMWLRYAVARFGWSPNLVAWELFNEVEWVDARYENRWPDICAWHKEMAEYLRSIDPYHHMVTTSSEMNQPDLLAPLDYVQPHTYSSSVLAAVAGAELPKDKPGFFGEFGPSDPGSADARKVLRDGMYGAMLANHAGTAMYWYWDAVENKNLYSEFTTANKILAASSLATHASARRLPLRVQTVGTADLSFAPGGGFEKAARTRLTLPEDFNAKALAGVPSYLQGANHRDMFPEPLTLTFAASKPGVVRVRLGTVAKTGANVHILVNGHEEAAKAYAASDADHPGDSLEATFPDGVVKIQIANDGVDWVTLANIQLTNAGTQASAQALGEIDWTVLRLTKAPGVSGSVEATVSGLSLVDGDYDVTVFDLDAGSSTTSHLAIHNFQLRNWPLTTTDEVLIFKRV